MKRFLNVSLVFLLGAGFGAGGLYVGMHWQPWRPAKAPPQKDTASLDSVLKELRHACANDKKLQGTSIHSAAEIKGKLTLRGWIARAEQKALLEAKAQALLDESPELKARCADGLASVLTVLPISDLLPQLQQDFDEGKGTEKDTEPRRRALMRTIRLDRAGFTDDGRLTFKGVCIRGNAKPEASSAALKDILKTRLEAAGISPDAMPQIELEVHFFASPALLIQKRLESEKQDSGVQITAAWYDGQGRLQLEGLASSDAQNRKLVDHALDALVKDPNHLPIFRAPGSGDEKLNIDVRLVTFDGNVLVRTLQQKLVELGRKENRPHLRRVRLVGLTVGANADEKNQAIHDEEGNPSYLFRVTGRILADEKVRDDVNKEVSNVLVEQLPFLHNPDQTLMALDVDFSFKANPVTALQDRLIERGMDGAVVTDALFLEAGDTLELVGRLHEPGMGDTSRRALEAALNSVLAGERLWAAHQFKPHEKRADVMPIAWTDVVKSVQAKLAADKDVGARLQIDRLNYRQEKEGLKLVAEGSYIGAVSEDFAKVIQAAIDDIISTRGPAPVSITGLKLRKNP